MIGLPWAGDRMLFVDIMSTRDSTCASMDSGTWTAIWSPSKSALKAAQTSGWSWMALPSMSVGSKACMPSRCRVGARLRMMGYSRTTSSRASQTSGVSRLDHLLGAFHRRHVALFHEAVVDEGLEELEGHLLGKTALVEPQVGPDGDDGAARVVDALAQQVLAEAALLSLEHVRKRAQRALVGARDGPAAPAVVEEHVDGLLEHPLLVADDDLRGIELLQPLEPVVAVDDATVEVVEIGGGKAPAVQGNQRPQVRRDHGDRRENHPLGSVARLAQGFDDAQTLDQFFLLGVGGGFLQVGPELLIQACPGQFP